MPESLEQRVEQVRHAAARLARLYGLSRFAAATAVAVATLGLADYALRPHDSIARWLLSAAAFGLAAFAVAKFVVPAFAYRQSRVAVARRIELRFPLLGERLSSAMAFLSQSADDPTTGSRDLRRAVIAEAEALGSQLDFRSALNNRAASRAALTAAVALGIAGLLIAVNPSAARLAAFRLAMPWRELPWPRRHELVFVEPPQRMAVGDDLELTLIDRRGTPPDRVELLLHYDTPAGSRTEAKDMKPLGERMVLRLDNVTRGFSYRARGGDDDTMPWAEIAVVEPPKIVELKVLIEPPAYSGLPPQSEGRVVKALLGSKLTIRGRLDKPIRSAAARAETQEFPLPRVEVGADGLSFTSGGGRSPWLVERSGTVWFELTDEQGLVFGRDTRIELHAAPDAPPSIAWETPGDHSFVTARAVISVRGVVKDDLSLRSIQLRFLRPRFSDEEQVAQLYEGESAGRPDKTNTTGRGFEGENRSFHYDWDLSRLAGLQPGDVLAARITAEDYKPQLTTTVIRRLTIITEEELADRITARQTAILGQLAEALRAAQQCRVQTSGIETRWRESGQLEAGDLNHLQSVQHNQQQVQTLLGDSPAGAEGQIAALLGELAANHAADQGVGGRLTGLLMTVQQLNRGPLPAIDQILTESLKTIRESLDAAPPLPAATSRRAEPDLAARQLAAAGGKQDEVIQSLEKLLGKLAEWDSFSRLAREVGQIRDDEDRLTIETDDLRTKVVAAVEIAPAHRAAARQLAARQQELGRRLDKLQTRMEEMLARLKGSDPLSAGTLADALDTARRLAIGGQMREAAARLSGGQLSEARQSEQQVLTSLKQLLESLSARRDYELTRNAASLRQAASELGALHQRGKKAAAEAEIAAAMGSDETKRRELARLKRALEELAKESEQLSRKLARLRAPRAAALLDQAATSSSAASKAANSGDAEQARQKSREAQQQLEQAEQELAQAVARAEEELVREQLAQIGQVIAGLAARQKNVIAETQRLEGSRDNAGNLQQPQHASLRDLAAEQRLLADEANQLRPRLTAAAAFALALEGAAEAMGQAGGSLQRGQTGVQAQAAEQRALTYLEQILEALRPDSQPPSASPPGGEQQQQTESQPPPSNLSGILAELKLLKLLQEQINRRTADLELKRADGGLLTLEEEQELAALARQQGRLADMALGLIQTATERPEDRPEIEKPAEPKGKTIDTELLRGLEK